jgi:hypothetical protein
LEPPSVPSWNRTKIQTGFPKAKPNLINLSQSKYGTPIANTEIMFRWLAIAYIVAVLVVSAKAKANNEFQNAMNLVFDHQTSK